MTSIALAEQHEGRTALAESIQLYNVKNPQITNLNPQIVKKKFFF